jgi:hypothetical protein
MSEKKTHQRVIRATFPTLEAAQQGKPVTGKSRLYQVSGPNGSLFYTWADGAFSALVNAAKAQGFETTPLDKAPTKEKVAGLLGQLSAEDRALLIAQFVPAPAPSADKAPTKKTGK